MKATFAITVALTLSAALLLCPLAGCKQEQAPAPVKPQPQGPQPTLPKVNITLGDVPLEVEVAGTSAEREKGYMFREEPKDSAMLFVWPNADFRSFHMKNVSFDLDIAFIDAGGQIFQIMRMEAFRIQRPNEPPSYLSIRPAKYALEAPAGWCQSHKVEVGTQVKIPPDVKGEPDAVPAVPADKKK